ncbi:hypothetical protein EN875_034035 [Mesorhizobium sp. M2D.F.Ca.ET.232.01.1.1]|uniref:phage upper tail fiber protein n=1 Tax=Mesorhizobium sp. M2D.F.Ca.ET.232.01.1.1 TaxID=2496670 RepID=UPI000FD4DA65|nr:hypothetical protein [Mesorhizobium sp. M2D.F.Ca.ET.232.01.1.1]TGP27362.1 hypothetical protein EN875_034035 [Mesorhizobium sp. M2D.F.Ca.ET.232.01.1.1]
MTRLGISGRDVVDIPAYSILTITVSGGSGTCEELGDHPGAFPETAINGSAAIGPFAVATRYRLRSVPASALSYEIAPADFPAVSSDVERIVKLTQAEYDALSLPDAATLYLVVG